MDEIIYLRDRNEDGIERCGVNDEEIIAYVRVDCTNSISIKEKLDLFMDGGETDESYRAPCNTYAHNIADQFCYPCAACKHL